MSKNVKPFDVLHFTNVNVSDIENNSNGTNIFENIEGKSTIFKNNGIAEIKSAELENFELNNIGKLEIDNIKTNTFAASNNGNVNVANVNTENLTFNSNSGSASIDNTFATNAQINTKAGNLNLNQISVENNLNVEQTGGELNVNDMEINKIFYLKSENGTFDSKNVVVKGKAYAELSNGKAVFSDTKVNEDFNIASNKNADLTLGKVYVGNDFNVYAETGVLSVNDLKIGNNLNAYDYGKYSKPQLSARASFAPRMAIEPAKSSDKGFSLIIDNLEIGGGMHVDNHDISIQIGEGKIGNDVNVNADNIDVNIDSLAVDGGNLTINGKNGSVKIDTAVVDNSTKITLGKGSLDAYDLLSSGDISMNIGGNVTSGKSIESENDNITITSGGDIKAENVTSTRENVNMFALGKVDAYKILAKQQGNIEAYNGDIILGKINGKTFVLKQDKNENTIRVKEANIDQSLSIAGDYIDFEQINHNGSDKVLDIDLPGVNGKAMENVNIGMIHTDKGAHISNLISMYADIKVDHEDLTLSRTYLIRNGYLKNSTTKFHLYGFNPVYNSEDDVIAYFVPTTHGKLYADIDFLNRDHKGHQDYIPFTAKSRSNRMFDEYTVIEYMDSVRDSYSQHVYRITDDLNQMHLKLRSERINIYQNNVEGSYEETMNMNGIIQPLTIDIDYDGYELSEK